MRYSAAALAAGLLLTINLLVLYELHSSIGPRIDFEDHFDDVIEQISARIERNRVAIAALDKRPTGEAIDTSGTESLHSLAVAALAQRHDELVQKVSELEERLENAGDPDVSKSSQDSLLNQLSSAAEAHSGMISETHSVPNNTGEEAYLSDSGKALEVYEEELVEALETASDVVTVQEVSCRKSICRVTYGAVDDNPSSMGPRNETRILLVQHLSERLNEVDLVLRHGTDPWGQEVMYIQIK